jgi:hypothetical protein
MIKIIPSWFKIIRKEHLEIARDIITNKTCWGISCVECPFAKENITEFAKIYCNKNNNVGKIAYNQAVSFINMRGLRMK